MGRLARKAKSFLGMIERVELSGDDREFISSVKAKYDQAVEAEQIQRPKEMADLRFCDPDKQWPETIKAQRDAEDRPCLSEDQIGPFIAEVCNQQRQNRPMPMVSPVADGADEDVAEVYQGMIRHIQNESNGDTARDTAFESMARCGRGFYRLFTDYEDPNSFNQVIKFARIPNHFMVFLDPSSQEPDGSDAQWCILEEDFTRERFEDTFPNAKANSLGTDDWASVGDAAPGWMSKDGESIRVVEIYWKAWREVKLCLLDDGKTCEEDGIPAGKKVKDRRTSMIPSIKWAKLTAIEVLDRKDVIGTHIPVLPVYGKELNINGERSWAGMIRALKDPQMRLNFFLSAQAEIIALAPRTPYIGPVGFMGNRENEWKLANKRSMAALEYEVVSVDGKPMPPPSRDMSEPPIRAITEAYQGAMNSLKSVSGMYNPTQGNAEHDLSGIATKALINQGDLANFHLTDNQNRTILQECRILIEWIPLVYDTPRVIQIVKDDGTHKTVAINQDPESGDPYSQNVKKALNVTSGKFAVTINAGPNYATKRIENLRIMLSMLQGIPALGTLAGDLVVSQMDTPIAKKVAERLHMGLPPAVLQAEAAEANGQKQDPQVAGLMTHVQQQQQVIQALTQNLSQMQLKVESKVLENQTKIQTALIQARAGIIEARERAEMERQDSLMNAAFDQALTHIDRQYDLLIGSQQAAMSQPQGGAAGNGAGGPLPAQPAGVPAGTGVPQ